MKKNLKRPNPPAKIIYLVHIETNLNKVTSGGATSGAGGGV
jgi:hypothetical protein